MMRIVRLRCSFAVVALAAVGLGACGDGHPFQVIEETEFAASLGIDLATMEQLPSGVYIQEITPGSGAQAMAGDIVNVDYMGWLADGTLFNDFDAIDFSLDGVVPGFRDGIIGMVVGETRLMVIPPEQGYGAAGNGSAIPPGAILVFQVTLNAVETP